MTLERFFGGNDRGSGLWDELGASAPTVHALARLCGESICRDQCPDLALSTEAQAMLYLARGQGVFELKVTDNAIDAVERFLTVHVEVEPDRMIALRVRDDAAATMRWFDGFRRLCAAGMLVHHLYRDFSLTHAGFVAAESIAKDQVADALAEIGADIDFSE